MLIFHQFKTKSWHSWRRWWQILMSNNLITIYSGDFIGIKIKMHETTQIITSSFCNRFKDNSFNTNCDLKDLCKIKFENLEFYPKMQTFFTAKKHRLVAKVPSHYPDNSSDSSFGDAGPCSVKSKKLERPLNTQSLIQLKPEPKPEPRSELKQSKINLREVYITEISDSLTFYVQDVDFIARSGELQLQCNQTAMVESTPRSVVVGEMYLVFENNKDEWHRGVVVTEQKNKITLFLVDYGRHVSVMLSQ